MVIGDGDNVFGGISQQDYFMNKGLRNVIRIVWNKIKGDQGLKNDDDFIENLDEILDKNKSRVSL